MNNKINKRKIGYAVYNPKKKKFFGVDGKWKSQPDEFFTKRQCNVMLKDLPETCEAKEVFFTWEDK